MAQAFADMGCFSNEMRTWPAQYKGGPNKGTVKRFKSNICRRLNIDSVGANTCRGIQTRRQSSVSRPSLRQMDHHSALSSQTVMPAVAVDDATRPVKVKVTKKKIKSALPAAPSTTAATSSSGPAGKRQTTHPIFICLITIVIVVCIFNVVPHAASTSTASTKDARRQGMPLCTQYGMFAFVFSFYICEQTRCHVAITT